jgi:hypothetical protein
MAVFELTAEQRQELGETEPARAFDPGTKQVYVLVRADVYERMKSIFDEDALDMRQIAVLVEQAMREEDAQDPSLESYQKYRLSS